jgi:hypothetical protein
MIMQTKIRFNQKMKIFPYNFQTKKQKPQN